VRHLVPLVGILSMVVHLACPVEGQNACASGDDCGGSRPYCVEDTCGQCRGDGDCDLDEACTEDGDCLDCESGDSCTTDEDCPDEYRCTTEGCGLIACLD
jgi:hypothetical protein